MLYSGNYLADTNIFYKSVLHKYINYKFVFISTIKKFDEYVYKEFWPGILPLLFFFFFSIFHAITTLGNEHCVLPANTNNLYQILLKRVKKKKKHGFHFSDFLTKVCDCVLLQ